MPLSQRSGVLEWCTNTISLSQYLTYTSNAHPGAHKRFRPNDMTTKKARCSLIVSILNIISEHLNLCSLL